MSQLGDRLRAAREGQGINLAQAAAETRILQRYIVALEDGEFQYLPGDVYARGFIRNYALYLDLSPEELIDLYRRERGISEPIRVVPVTAALRIRRFVVPGFFSVFFVVLALVGVTYLVLSTTNRVGENAGQVAILPTKAPEPSPLPTTQPAPTSAPLTANAPTQAPLPDTDFGPAATAAAGGAIIAPTSPPDAPIVFEVRIDPGDNPGSWLSITADGKPVLQRTLKPSEAWSGTAERSLQIKAGNAAVVAVLVNGQQMPRLSTIAGDVQTFTWPPRP